MNPFLDLANSVENGSAHISENGVSSDDGEPHNSNGAANGTVLSSSLSVPALPRSGSSTTDLLKYARQMHALLHERSRRLATLESNLHCSICTDYFIAPYTLDCGHTFCYNCILAWFESLVGQEKPKKCPTCRCTTTSRPRHELIVARLVEDYMTVINNQEAKWLLECIETTRSQMNALPNHPFHRHFPTDYNDHVLLDQDDGVGRCSRCNWEVLGGQCVNCGHVYEEGDDNGIDSEFEDNARENGEDDDDAGSLDSFIVGDDEGLEEDSEQEEGQAHHEHSIAEHYASRAAFELDGPRMLNGSNQQSQRIRVQVLSDSSDDSDDSSDFAEADESSGSDDPSDSDDDHDDNHHDRVNGTSDDIFVDFNEMGNVGDHMSHAEQFDEIFGPSDDDLPKWSGADSMDSDLNTMDGRRPQQHWENLDVESEHDSEEDFPEVKSEPSDEGTSDGRPVFFEDDSVEVKSEPSDEGTLEVHPVFSDDDMLDVKPEYSDDGMIEVKSEHSDEGMVEVKYEHSDGDMPEEEDSEGEWEGMVPHKVADKPRRYRHAFVSSSDEEDPTPCPQIRKRRRIVDDSSDHEDTSSDSEDNSEGDVPNYGAVEHWSSESENEGEGESKGYEERNRRAVKRRRY